MADGFPNRYWLILFAASTATGGTISSRYMEFPNAVPGTVLKVEKYLDEGDGTVKAKIGGVPVSADRIERWLEIESQARSARIGRLSEELEGGRQSMRIGEKVRVVVHAKYPEIRYPDKTKTPAEDLLASSLSAAAILPVEGFDALEARTGLSDCLREGKGKLVCDATREQLENLKSDPAVGSVVMFRKGGNSGPEFSTLANSGYNPGPVPSGAGLGVRVATFEAGLTASFLSCLGVSATYETPSSATNPGDVRHSQAAFKSLVHAAPSATFYHRRSWFYDGTEDVNYIINNGIQSVSMSQFRGGSSAFRSTYPEFLVVDDFAYRSPFPVFATPTYNLGYQYEVNWQCYNAISVGNVRHTNDATFEMAECTQAKNPPPVYGSCISGSGADCAGDREMPHLLAPGIPNSGTEFAATCLGGTIGCGTSWSAPVVNGLAADVIAADSRMAGWPEKVRATLILTAQNVESGDWTVGGDERDGAGVVSGSEAVSFAQNHTSVSAGNTAVEKGMAAGSMYASDFSSGNKRFYYRVPNPKPSNKHLRVVLTWDSNPVVGGSVNALSDLDLIVQKDGVTQGSGSWDSNVEVVDVAAAGLTAGGSYYIDISPYANRIPASGSRTNYFYYSLAWSWVADHAP